MRVDDERAVEIQEWLEAIDWPGGSIFERLASEYVSDLLADRAERIERIQGVIAILQPLEGLSYEPEEESAINLALQQLRALSQRKEQ